MALVAGEGGLGWGLVGSSGQGWAGERAIGWAIPIGAGLGGREGRPRALVAGEGWGSGGGVQGLRFWGGRVGANFATGVIFVVSNA